MILMPMLLAASLSTADAALFAQRLAGDGFGPQPIVTVGALPPDWTAPVLLPRSVTLLGSVYRVNQKSVELLYAPSDGYAAFSAYETALEQSGFAPLNQGMSSSVTGGFAPQNPERDTALLCRGAQGVVLRLWPGNDLRVNIFSPDAPGIVNVCTASRRSPDVMLASFAVLPTLRAPEGVMVTPNAMGGSSAGFGPNGASASVTFGAAFEGNTSVAQLFDAFTTQLKSDGWRQGGSAKSQDGAFAAFGRDFNGQQWKAHLMLYASEKPRHFQGLLIAAGEPLQKPQPPPPARVPRIAVTLKKSDTPVALELMRRIVGVDTNRYAAVFIKKTPPDLPKNLPLPRGMLLGSTVVFQELDSQGSDTLYYKLTRAELNAYLRTLALAAWKPFPRFTRVSGFVSDADTEPIDFCKQAEPALIVSAQPGSNAVTIVIARSNTLGGCHAVPVPPNEAQLPKLVTPGARANHLWTTQGGSASAFTSSQSPSALLDAFTTQMLAQRCRTVNRMANTLSGTATFVCNSGPHPQTAAITVTRSSTESQSYIASMTVY